MSEQQKILNRIDELINHRLKRDHFEITSIRESLTEFLGDNEIKFIYPYNLYSEDVDKLFYVIHGNFISEITFRRHHTDILSRRFEPDFVDYTRPDDIEINGALLSIRLISGNRIKLNSMVNIDEVVRKVYSRLIHEIYLYTISK